VAQFASVNETVPVFIEHPERLLELLGTQTLLLCHHHHELLEVNGAVSCKAIVLLISARSTLTRGLI
jgi:hypothetical protein